MNIPVADGQPSLGTWQEIYLCEHRNHGDSRRMIVTIQGEQAKPSICAENIDQA